MTPMSPSTAHQFDLSGGALCLDFVNTLADRPRGEEEHLGDAAALLEWARQAEVAPRREIGALADELTARPHDVAPWFDGALELRETLYRIFRCLPRGDAPTEEDLARLNGALAEALPHLLVAAGDEGFSWQWRADGAGFDRVLWPVVRSAADLLTSSEVPLLRECASGTCSWLFVDRSRNHRRKWCDMSTCGNRAKARRHYRRRKRRG